MNALTTKSNILKLISVFFCFAVMGFIDIIGVATNYVRVDFSLDSKIANFLPMMSFIWFLLISVPTAQLMNVIGRKMTVMLSLAITAAALVIPVFQYDKVWIFVSFSLLGIGNTIMQVSLNPLIGNIVGENDLSRALTFGQFIKSIISFAGPVLMGMFAIRYGNWRIIFYLYGAASVAAFAILWFTRIERETVQRRSNNFFEIIGLLKNKYVSECFLLILMSVGFEICLTTLVPEHFSKVLSVSVEKGGMACSVYYIMKMTGTLLGTFILSRLPASKFLKYTTAGLLLSFIGYWLSHTAFFLYLFLILIGLFGANVFAVAFSIALQHSSDRPNDVSALMIAALAGGAFLPPLMGVISDAVGFVASFIIPGIVALVMAVISFRIYGQE